MDTNKPKFKAPSWVGNLYQKFESICEDVDVLVGHGQDHVKYVGDQVQTVGEGMKNFCSSIMQDLVIPLDEKKDLIATQVHSKKDEIQSVFLMRDAAQSSSMEQVEAFEKTDQAIDTQPLEKEVDAISIRKNDNQLLNASSPVNDCVPASPLSPHKMEESPLHFQQDENNEVIDGLLEEKSPLELSGSFFSGITDASSCAENEREASECWESDIEFDDSGSHLFEEDEDQVNESPLEEKSSPSEVTESVFTYINYASSCVNNEHEPSSCREFDMEQSDCASDSNQLVNWENQTGEGPVDNKSLFELSESVFTDVNDASSPTSSAHEVLSCRESVIEFDDSALYSHQEERNEATEGSSEEKLSPSGFSESVVTSVTDSSSRASNEHVASSYNESDIEFDYNELAVVGTPDDLVDGTTETFMETISLQDEVKHPTCSCAIVDNNVFGSVSHTAKNFRSYEKKIREAFTSKRRLAKEYKHLGIWYGDIDTEIESSLSTARSSLSSVHVNRLESNEVPNEELCDWELL